MLHTQKKDKNITIRWNLQSVWSESRNQRERARAQILWLYKSSRSVVAATIWSIRFVATGWLIDNDEIYGDDDGDDDDGDGDGDDGCQQSGAGLLVM